jgi:hypothetical protein
MFLDYNKYVYCYVHHICHKVNDWGPKFIESAILSKCTYIPCVAFFKYHIIADIKQQLSLLHVLPPATTGWMWPELE